MGREFGGYRGFSIGAQILGGVPLSSHAKTKLATLDKTQYISIWMGKNTRYYNMSKLMGVGVAVLARVLTII